MRSRDHITHTEQAGRWISDRMEQLGLTQKGLARRLGVAERTVWSGVNGKSVIQRHQRANWERVLGWIPGSLSAAYEDGTEPALLPEEARFDGADPIAELLSGLPPGVHDELRQLLTELDELGIAPDKRLQIAQDWVTRERQIARLHQDIELADRRIAELRGDQRVTFLRDVAAAQRREHG